MLAVAAEHEFFLSDFALHSIGVLLFRRRQPEVFRVFVEDVILSGAAEVVSLSTDDMEAVTAAAVRFGFDFDDAYYTNTRPHKNSGFASRPTTAISIASQTRAYGPRTRPPFEPRNPFKTLVHRGKTKMYMHPQTFSPPPASFLVGSQN